MASMLVMGKGEVSNGGAAAKAQPRAEISKSDRERQSVGPMLLKEHEKESLMHWLSAGTHAETVDGALSNKIGETAVRPSSSSGGSDESGGVMLPDPMVLMDGIMSCGVSGETAANLLVNYYGAMGGYATPSASEASQRSGSIKRKERLDRWNREVSALTVPDGQCYLRAVRFSRRPSFFASLGRFPSLRNFVAELKPGDLDVDAARALGFYRVGGYNCFPVQYHISNEHATHDIRVGSVYDVIASTLQHFPFFNDKGLVCSDPCVSLAVVAFGSLGGNSRDESLRRDPGPLECVLGDTISDGAARFAADVLAGGAFDAVSMPVAVTWRGKTPAADCVVDVVAGAVYLYRGNGVLRACGRRVDLNHHDGFVCARAAQQWEIQARHGFEMHRVLDEQLARLVTDALAPLCSEPFDLGLVTAYEGEGFPVLDEGSFLAGASCRRVAADFLRIKAFGQFWVNGVHVDMGDSVCVGTGAIAVDCERDTMYTTRSMYSPDVPEHTLFRVEAYGSGFSYLRLFQRVDWKRVSEKLGPMPPIVRLGNEVYLHDTALLRECCIVRVGEERYDVQYAMRADTSERADIVLPHLIAREPYSMISRRVPTERFTMHDRLSVIRTRAGLRW